MITWLKNLFRRDYGEPSPYYRGPAKYNRIVKRAIDICLEELPKEAGKQMRLLPVHYIIIEEREATGWRYGWPIYHHNGRDGYGWYMRPKIVVPENANGATVIHEVGHRILDLNGFDPGEHHERFPKFFGKYTLGKL